MGIETVKLKEIVNAVVGELASLGVRGDENGFGQRNIYWQPRRTWDLKRLWLGFTPSVEWPDSRQRS